MFANQVWGALKQGRPNSFSIDDVHHTTFVIELITLLAYKVWLVRKKEKNDLKNWKNNKPITEFHGKSLATQRKRI